MPDADFTPAVECDSIDDQRFSGNRSSYDSQRYHLFESIEAGGYGEVWLATDRLLNQVVAVKKLHGYLDHEPGIIEFLRREVEAGRKTTSRNVVKVYDLVRIDRQECVVMEYVKGRSLSELFGQRRPSPKALTQILCQMCAGLAAIHEAGFSHGDFKPDNILVDDRGRVVIIDLGRATELSEEPGSSTFSPFLAPELRTASPSQRSDIYAFGKVVIYLADGARAGDSDKLRSYPWLWAIVQRCLAEIPSDRYNSATELQKDLLPAVKRLEGARRHTKWQVLVSAAIGLGVLALLPSILTRLRAAGAPQSTDMILVTPSAENPLSRMLADLIAIYLETEHFAVSRPDYLFKKATSTRSGIPLPSTTVSVSLVVLDGMPQAQLNFEASRSTRDRNIVVRSSAHIVFDALSRVATELGLARPRPAFDFAGLDADQLQRFASAWRMADQLQFYSLIQGQERTVPALMLKARLNAHLFGSTSSEEYRQEADSALTALEKAGIRVSDTVLERASLADLAASSVGVLKAGLASLRTTASIYRALGERQVAAGFASEALGSFSTALKRDPYSTQTYLAASNAYTTLWLDERAAELLEQASKLDPSNGEVYSTLGYVYIRMGSFEQARRALERNMELKPTADSAMLLGLANLLCGNHAQGLSLLKSTVAEKKSLSALATLGAALRWTGNSAHSREVLLEAKRLGNELSQDPSVLGTLAMVNAQLGDIHRADVLIAKAGAGKSFSNTEVLYDATIVDAFALRWKACRDKLAILEQRHFPTAFARRDPQVINVLKHE